MIRKRVGGGSIGHSSSENTKCKRRTKKNRFMLSVYVSI
jgi:hypothetical protein